MRISDTVQKKLKGAWFGAGLGFSKERVQINKTTYATIEVEEDGTCMNPPAVVRVYKNNKFQKRYYAYSERECINAIKNHK